jgi:hypothetical protein
MGMDIQKANSGNLAYSTALPPVPKPPLVHKASARHKEMADRFRGDRSYKEHYAYLLDWYAKDRNDNVPDANKYNKAVADEHVKQSLQDVFESLVHLDKKIDKVAVLNKLKKKGDKIKAARRSERLFTKLIDTGRFEEA